jgi:hypothetical protein
MIIPALPAMFAVLVRLDAQAKMAYANTIAQQARIAMIQHLIIA